MTGSRSVWRSLNRYGRTDLDSDLLDEHPAHGRGTAKLAACADHDRHPPAHTATPAAAPKSVAGSCDVPSPVSLDEVMFSPPFCPAPISAFGFAAGRVRSPDSSELPAAHG
jgi:hypothetical protein